ncbi:MAG TPA: Amuc_1100 family pilus-like protein [Methylomirabilota bacterium]|nr:Amuc_1100 family pilus-like protein [Methylomirabilota bacterium]
MGWIKRNLYLVIGGAVALALLAVAVVFLLSKRSANAAVTEELGAQTAAFNELINRPVHPGTDKVDNISAAREEVKKLDAFVSEVRQEFTMVNTNSINNQQFRLLLDTTVAGLQAEADRLGISLPTKDYWFTFAAQRAVVSFNPKNVDALAAQLDDIAALTRVLYNSKVHAIINMKRVPVATEDSLGSTDYHARKGETNEWAVIMPYEVSFSGFTSELEAVLEGLVNAKQCYIVKSVAVDKMGATATAEAQVTPMAGGLANRYGRPMAPPPVAQAPQRPVTRNGLTTILDESKLKFTIIVEVVKLRPPSATMAAATPAPEGDPSAAPVQ